MDASEPSTNGVSASNLFRLASLLGDDKYETLAKETVGAFEAEIMQYPWLFGSFMPSVVAGVTGVRGVIRVGAGEPVVEAVEVPGKAKSDDVAAAAAAAAAVEAAGVEKDGLPKGEKAETADADVLVGGETAVPVAAATTTAAAGAPAAPEASTISPPEASTDTTP
ncbi:hypothetical protein V493_02910, partial [Pseudogymnoascus sp. VKM F-4281 (FW-2241)]